MLISILEQSLLFLPLALGVYISYGVLRIPDLTTDGSFVLGAALYAISIHSGLHPALGMVLASTAGLCAGSINSLLQSRFHLNPLIAGILLVFIFNTLTLKLMGRPNLSLFDHPSIFDSYPKLLTLAGLSLALIIAVGYLITSRIGLHLRAFGNNPTLLNLSGKNSHLYRLLGLSISNGLVGCSGALTAQANGYADLSMGTGMILIALATVIIGQQLYRTLFKRPPLPSFAKLFCSLLGIIAYFSTVNMLISLGFDPIYLRLMIGLCLIVFLTATQQRLLLREAS